MADVWWAVLLERNPTGSCVSQLLRVAVQGERRGYKMIPTHYARTDFSRNAIAKLFLELSKDPHDTLIMLDNDHHHPDDLLYGLARHDAPVVSALAFRRGPPHDPCVFVRDANGDARALGEWKPGTLYHADVVGHAAIAIQRRAFLHMAAEGIQPPFWRYGYTDGTDSFPSEDFYFCDLLVKAGVPIICDTGVICPHHTDGWVDESSWAKYVEDHPEILLRPKPAPVADAAPVAEPEAEVKTDVNAG